MGYEIHHLPFEMLMGPVSDVTAALVRLDERIARSPVGQGWIARSHFTDACASLLIDGELVHLEELVLHDAGTGIRTPTRELVLAADVLRMRRRIASHPAGWALSPSGLRALCGVEGDMAGEGTVRPPFAADDANDPLAAEIAAIDAVLARTDALLAGKGGLSGINRALPDGRPGETAGLFEEWRNVLTASAGLPPVLRCAVLIDAWDRLNVMRPAVWLGRLLAASLLRETGLTQAHLVSVNAGLRTVPHERRGARDSSARLPAILEGLAAAASIGLREHDRLLITRRQLERHLTGRRQSSRLPALIELVLARPLVSTGMIAAELDLTPQGALKIVRELNLREMTGRGRFRAWGIL